MSEQSNRREFLQYSTLAAAGLIAGGSNTVTMAADAKQIDATPSSKAVLKLSAQEGRIPGATLKEQLDFMEKNGFTGLEVGGKDLSKRVNELKEALKGRPIQMSAICAGFSGWLIAEQKDQRDLAMTTIKEILSAAGELGALGVIAVPGFNGQQPSVPHLEARKLLTGFARWDRRPATPPNCLLQELADHAVKAGTSLILEPLNRDECYFLRTVADGASICKDIDSPGLTTMGDFWHMTWEETSDYGAFLSGGKYLRHVHIASRKRRLTPGEDGEADNYIDGFKGLKAIGYQQFVSLECGCEGDKATVVARCADLLRKQWEQA